MHALSATEVQSKLQQLSGLSCARAAPLFLRAEPPPSGRLPTLFTAHGRFCGLVSAAEPTSAGTRACSLQPYRGRRLRRSPISAAVAPVSFLSTLRNVVSIVCVCRPCHAWKSLGNN